MSTHTHGTSAHTVWTMCVRFTDCRANERSQTAESQNSPPPSLSLSSSVHNTTSKSFLVLFLLGMYDAAGKSDGDAASARRRQRAPSEAEADGESERLCGDAVGRNVGEVLTFLSQTLFSSFAFASFLLALSFPLLGKMSLRLRLRPLPYPRSLIMITV